MIYTVTLNPSLDRTIEVAEIIYDDVNEIIEQRSRPGGKGIDVSRVIKELGGQSIALGFAGGYNGIELEGRLVSEGIVCDFTRINAETGQKIVVYQRKKNLRTLLSMSGPEISLPEVTAFHNKIKEIPEGSYIVLSGGIPNGIDADFFARIITTLKEKGINATLDTDHVALQLGVQAGPYCIKPNIHEFGRLVGKNITNVEELLEMGKGFQDIVEYTVVSMGARGVVGISAHGCYQVTPPKVKVRSAFGAGDSLVAGIAYVLSKKGDFKEALTVGVACGTASMLSPGETLCTKEDVEVIKKDVIVKTI